MSIKHSLQVLLIALSSFYLGWLANEHQVGKTASTASTASIRPAPGTPLPGPQATLAETKANLPPSVSQRFRQALDTGDMEAALQLYEQEKASDEVAARLLRAAVMANLQSALATGDGESLMATADAWLSRYYDDTEVLMILAEYQRRQGYPDEAARVVQFAFTYAHETAQREKVSIFLQALVEKTDSAFSLQEQWVELLGFYQLLDSIGLSRPDYQLRQARVCLELRDISCARALLSPLAKDVMWAGKANELLALLEPQAEQPARTERDGSGIPLLRRGKNFLVRVRLNGVSEVTLMIDTGASVTSLSQDSFAALSERSFYDYLGWRLFNTANGVTRGNIYRAHELQLGDHVLQEVEVAVLNFRQANGIDGLLGMNVLQNYRFEIDQERAVFYLRDR